MPEITVKFKKLRENAVMPTKAHLSDVGYDFTIIDLSIKEDVFNHSIIIGHTGLAIELPKGYWLGLFMRSSTPKEGLILSNCVGVVDNGYRGEIQGRFRIIEKYYDNVRNYKWDRDNLKKLLNKKYFQGILFPQYDIEWIERDELKDSERGEGGFGSSNK